MVRSTRERRLAGGLIVLLTAAASLTACASNSSASGSSASSGAATYYKGKTITITTKSSPGGNGNTTARLLSQYLPQFIPGHPKVVVKVNAGGSGSVMMKNVDEVYPADGTQLALPDTAVVLRWMFKQDGTDYPLDKMQMVGDLSAPLIAVVRTASGADVNALTKLTTPLRAGNTAPGATGVIDLTLGMKLLGIPVKEVYGFSGAGPIALAIERGELDAGSPGAGSYLTGFQAVTSSGKAYALYQVGDPDGKGGLIRSTAFPNIPTLQELYTTAHGTAPSGPDWDAVLKLADMSELGLYLAARSDTPQAALTALREGWDKMSADPAFAADVKKTLGGADIVSSTDGAKLLTSLLATNGTLLTSIQTAADPK